MGRKSRGVRPALQPQRARHVRRALCDARQKRARHVGHARHDRSHPDRGREVGGGSSLSMARRAAVERRRRVVAARFPRDSRGTGVQPGAHRSLEAAKLVHDLQRGLPAAGRLRLPVRRSSVDRRLAESAERGQLRRNGARHRVRHLALRRRLEEKRGAHADAGRADLPVHRRAAAAVDDVHDLPAGDSGWFLRRARRARGKRSNPGRKQET